MEKKFIIYKYTSPNGGVYIGQTSKSIDDRAGSNGERYVVLNKETGEYFQPLIARAILKYGFDNFKKEVLYEGLTSEEADEKEIELISYYKENGVCYNICSGGKGVPGIKHTKIKQYDLDGTFIKSWDSVEDAAIWLGDKKKCQGNISACCTGKKHRAYGFIWRYADDNSIVEPLSPYRERVCQLTKEGKCIAIYDSVKKAGESVNLHPTGIGNVLHGWAKTCGGYRWQFERDYIKNNKN